MKKKNIKVIVATHKKYDMPKDKMYIPLHVGAENKEDIGYTKDNTKDNISIKNPYYCELTGLYWAWKNLKADYIGLSHYRRHFAIKKQDKKDMLKNVLSYDEADKLLNNTDIILPKKNNYYIISVYNHYKKTMYIETLDKTRNIIEEKYPEYLKEFDRLKKRRSMHAYNMFIMKKEILDEYCTWLFDILGELEKRIDSKSYTDFHKRFYGRVSERLLDVFINTKGYKYKEVKVRYIGKVNWFKKIIGVSLAILGVKKYEKSF